jgi:hypothetical protein
MITGNMILVHVSGLGCDVARSFGDARLGLWEVLHSVEVGFGFRIAGFSDLCAFVLETPDSESQKALFSEEKLMIVCFLVPSLKANDRW